LSKHITDASRGEFFKQLSYKLSNGGKTLIKIDPKYTSQTCSDCGAVDKKSRLSQYKFVCTSCGAERNADIHAGDNILSNGIGLSPQREPVRCASAKEPPCFNLGSM